MLYMMQSICGHHIYWCMVLSVICLIEGTCADCVESDENKEQSNITKDCVNGRCILGECECYRGWTGLSCDECGGRLMLNSDAGFVTDGMKDYAKARECSWIIQPKSRNVTIRLRLLEFATECGWDYLYIFDGDSASSPILATFNGLLPQDSKDAPGFERYMEVVAKSGTVFIHFFSDVEYVMKGFNISYEVDLCPQNCSGHGTCTVENMDAQCNCDVGWFGEACEIEFCSDNCSSARSLVYCGDFLSPEGGDGICYSSNCINSTTASTNESFWCERKIEEEVLNAARSSHSGVIVNDSIWLYGGIQFGNLSSTDGFTVHNLSSGEWTNVNPVTTDSPSWRYGHSLVMYNSKITVFGGREVLTSQAMDQVWEFDLLNKSWKEVVYSDNFSSVFSNKALSPLALWGHSGTLVKLSDGRTVMLVLFGFHTEYEYSGFVYEYDLENSIWSQVITTGAKIEAAFGHSTTWDPENKICYIHGGIVFVRLKKYGMTDALLSYDPTERKFKALRSSGIPRYLHTGLLIDGVLLVYGGCTHNDSDKSTGALCFSPSLQAYYVACDIWDSLPSTPSMLDPARYGHVALKLNGGSGGSATMVVHGGYDGRILHDLLFYQTASCSSHSDKTTCAEIHHEGLACMWTGSACVASQKTSAYQSQNVSCEYKPGGFSSFCPSLKDCSSCVNSVENCVWCQEQCSSSCEDSAEACPDNDGIEVYCGRFRSCRQCQLNEQCHWSQGNCVKESNNTSAMNCSHSCGMQTSCNTCVSSECMWCSNKNLCVSTSSYVVQFPYGECTKWINQKDHCDIAGGCSGYRTCESCFTDPFCGWCDDGSQTGLGTCQIGSVSSSQTSAASPNVLSYNRLSDNNSSSSCEPERWFFTECPLCQCNGHSQCQNGTSECVFCKNRTTGDQCEKCSDGYFGQATNGGTCVPCQCFDRADACDSTDGKCFCSTKGATGDKCENCDNSAKYFGDPSKNGTCFYRLLINYSFTFTLTLAHDRYVTAINFENTLTDQSDVELNFESLEPCDVRFTVHSLNYAPVEDDGGLNSSTRGYEYEEEVLYVQGVNKFSHDFSGSRYGFGDQNSNATIRIYVNNFTVPTWIQVSLVQRNNYLLMLLLILFSCFLILLLLTALAWKLKMLYDACQRRRQHEEQLEQMAARPFASFFLRFDDDEALLQSEHVVSRKEVDVVAEEAFATGKASVVSAILRMPSVGDEKDIPGENGTLSVGTALLGSAKSVSSGNNENSHNKTRSRSKRLKIIFKRGRASTPSVSEYASNRRRIEGAQPTDASSVHRRTESSLSRRQRSKRLGSAFSSFRSRSVSPCNDAEGSSTEIQGRRNDSLSSDRRHADSRSEGVTI